MRAAQIGSGCVAVLTSTIKTRYKEAFRYKIVFGYKLGFECLRSTTKTRYMLSEPAFAIREDALSYCSMGP